MMDCFSLHIFCSLSFQSFLLPASFNSVIAREKISIFFKKERFVRVRLPGSKGRKIPMVNKENKIVPGARKGSGREGIG